jgi:DNA-binding NtrC family response regulator
MGSNLSDSFVGDSLAIRAVREEVRYAARSDAKILLTGASGVGKEIVARLVHAESGRRSAAFVAMNCAGVPDSLLESELFGHVRGSFTGAYRARTGLLEQANRGTIFMDEVGEMSARMQTLLLRFFESGEIQRVGSEGLQPHVDARVIAATNRNLVDRISASEFREDLYYRLNVIHIRIPALRERRDDIPLLFCHFLRMYSGQYQTVVPHPTGDALARLLDHDWPGNVRELKNVAERLIVRGAGPAINAAALASVMSPRTGAASAKPAAPGDPAEPADLANTLFGRVVHQGESFWDVVYEPFMSRDITRTDLRRVVGRGLEQTSGNCKMLVRLFNMQTADYKKFLNFLHKYGCNPRFHQVRPAAAAERPSARTA